MSVRTPALFCALALSAHLAFAADQAYMAQGLRPALDAGGWSTYMEVWGFGNALDSAAVPEPAIWLMLVAGLGVFAARARRRAG